MRQVSVEVPVAEKILRHQHRRFDDRAARVSRERSRPPLGITLRSLNILKVDKQLPQADSLAEPSAFPPKSPALRRNLQGRRLLNQS